MNDLTTEELTCVIHAAERYQQERALAKKPTSIIDSAIAKLREHLKTTPEALGAVMALDVLAGLNAPSRDCQAGVHMRPSEGGPCVRCGDVDQKGER